MRELFESCISPVVGLLFSFCWFSYQKLRVDLPPPRMPIHGISQVPQRWQSHAHKTLFMPQFTSTHSQDWTE